MADEPHIGLSYLEKRQNLDAWDKIQRMCREWYKVGEYRPKKGKK